MLLKKAFENLLLRDLAWNLRIKTAASKNLSLSDHQGMDACKTTIQCKPDRVDIVITIIRDTLALLNMSDSSNLIAIDSGSLEVQHLTEMIHFINETGDDFLVLSLKEEAQTAD